MELETEIVTYDLRGFKIPLERTTDKSEKQVFWPTAPPTATGITHFLAESLEIERGDTVIDMGTGTGILAILSARLGAKEVYAVDKQEEACELANRNVAHSIASGLIARGIVKVRRGDLFEPLEGILADEIIGDVSGVAKLLAGPWYPEGVPTSGYYGSELPIKMLEEAGKYLRDGGKVYIPIGTIADDEGVESYAREKFGPNNVRQLEINKRKKKIDEREVVYFEYKDKVGLLKAFDEGKELFDEGKVKFFKREGGVYIRLEKINKELIENTNRIFWQFRVLKATKG